MTPTQLQIYYRELRKIGELNQTFLQFVDEGMTKEQLQKLIDMRPAL